MGTQINIGQVRGLEDRLPESVEPSIVTYFNGTNSEVTLDTPITLANDGDYIEIEFYGDDFGTSVGSSKAMGIVGEVGTSASSIGFQGSNGQLYIKGSGAVWLTTVGLLNPAAPLTTYILRVEWGATDISIYLDNVFQKTVTKGDFIVSNFGNAYNDFQGGIGQVTLNSSAGLLVIPSLFNYADATKTNITEAVNPTNYIDNTDYSRDVFYEFTTSGNDGEPEFTVYTNTGSNTFAGFKINLYNDLTPAIYANVWTVRECEAYRYIEGNMVNQSIVLIREGESEFLYKRDGKSDFTGGYHGDETVTAISFYANGIEVPINTNISLTKVNSFHYTQDSKLHTTDDALHGVEAKQYCLVTIANGGYKVNTTLELLEDILFEKIYVGISTIGKGCATTGHNEKNAKAVFTGSGSGIAEDRVKSFYGVNEVTGFSVLATSILTNPIVDDASCLSNVIDRPNDSKYYRGYYPTSTILSGVEIDTEMEIIFKYQE